MTIANPLIIAGKAWDRFSTQLSIASKYRPDGSMDASIALRLIPTRINEDGQVETLESEAIGIFRGSLAELRDQAEGSAVTAIKAALDEFVAAKGY